jgi:site-specific recombinase XerD
MNQNYSLHFYLKTQKAYLNGPKPIYLRITINGEPPKEVSIGRKCEPTNWISKANRAKGNTESLKMLNAYLDAIATKFEQIHTTFVKLGMEVSTDVLLNKYLGKEQQVKYVLEVFSEHNDNVRALVGKGFSVNTLKTYKSSLTHLTNYIQKEFRIKDVSVSNIDYKFIVGYEFYLRTTKNCIDTSAAKYVKHLRKIINICLAHQWISYDPFLRYKNTAKPRPREFLSKDELERITEKMLSIPRLGQVRDVFVFSCYTGLAYIDVNKLRKSEIRKGDDGTMWIYTTREKTDTPSHIPLMDVANELILKYADNAQCEAKGLVFPVLSNQRMNSYLKEIADVCGVTKVLTFHMARHTFATTVTLSNDVPMETVSKMLGHKSIKTTLLYAKVLDAKVGRDMSVLNRKLSKSIC